MALDDIAQFFKILKKCQSKFDCLIFERTETNFKQTLRFHPRKIICLGRFLITSIVFTAVFKSF